MSFLISFVLSVSAFLGLPSPHGEWLLSNVPSYDGGTYSTALYNTGTGLEADSAQTPENNSFMQIVRNTNLRDVSFYCAKLERRGYHKAFENQIENNYYYGYRQGDKQVYFYYNASTSQTRVIDDCCNTTTLDNFGYYQSEPGEPPTETVTDPSQEIPDEPIPPEELDDGEDIEESQTIPEDAEPEDSTETTEEPPTEPVDGEITEPDVNESAVYQFSFPYYDINHLDKTLYARNGMLYVVKLFDNRLIIIDGGAPLQCSDHNVNEFMSFIHEITGTAENERINIAMWYGTHCHADHINFFYKVVHKHRNEVNVERLMFNYQAFSVIEYSSRVGKFRNLLKSYCPNAKYIKARSGYSFQLNNAFCEVLYSHEDFVNAEDATVNLTNANDGCCILKLVLNGKTFLFPGDINTAAEDILLRNFSEKTLRADVLQGAHHMINNLERIYPVIAPTYVMCPQSEYRTKKRFASYQSLLEIVDEENFFFADRGIYGFAPKDDGSITISFRESNCGAYDGSGL